MPQDWYRNPTNAEKAKSFVQSRNIEKRTLPPFLPFLHDAYAQLPTLPLSISSRLVASLDNLAKSLLHDPSTLIGPPDLMRRLVDNVPTDEVLGEMRKIFLLTAPFAIASHADTTADDDEWSIGTLNRASAGHLVLGQRVGHQVLLELSLDVFPSLVS